MDSYIVNMIQTSYILLTKITAAQSGDAPSYHRVRGLYLMVVIFVVTIDSKVTGIFVMFVSEVFHG